MPTHFLLAGEVKNPDDLEYADFLLTDHPKASEALDLVLGTQGWRRFAEQAPPVVVSLTESRSPTWPPRSAWHEQRRIAQTAVRSERPVRVPSRSGPAPQNRAVSQSEVCSAVRKGGTGRNKDADRSGSDAAAETRRTRTPSTAAPIRRKRRRRSAPPTMVPGRACQRCPRAGCARFRARTCGSASRDWWQHRGCGLPDSSLITRSGGRFPLGFSTLGSLRAGHVPRDRCRMG